MKAILADDYGPAKFQLGFSFFPTIMSGGRQMLSVAFQQAKLKNLPDFFNC